MQSQSDLSEHVNPRPTVSCLWQEDFTSTIQIPLQTNLHLLKSLGLCLQAARTQTDIQLSARFKSEAFPHQMY